MIRHVKRLLAAPSAESLALRELEEARRSLLEAQSAAEYADAMATYHTARIERLCAFLTERHGERDEAHALVSR